MVVLNVLLVVVAVQLGSEGLQHTEVQRLFSFYKLLYVGMYTCRHITSVLLLHVQNYIVRIYIYVLYLCILYNMHVSFVLHI